MSKKEYSNQPRKPQSLIGKIAEHGNTAINNRIPSAAISTNDAERLSSMLKIDSSIKFYFKQNC